MLCTFGFIIQCRKFSWRLTDTQLKKGYFVQSWGCSVNSCGGWRIKCDNLNRLKQRIKNKQDNNWYEVCMTLSQWTHIHPSSINCYFFLIRHSTHNNGFVLFKRAGQNLVVMNITLKKHFLSDSKTRNRTDLNSPGWLLEWCTQPFDFSVACIWQIKHLTTSWPAFSTVLLIINHK